MFILKAGGGAAMFTSLTFICKIKIKHCEKKSQKQTNKQKVLMHAQSAR